MRRFILLIKPSDTSPCRRLEFGASDRDHALYLAESHGGDADLELWEGETLLAEMSRASRGLWVLGGNRNFSASIGRNFSASIGAARFERERAASSAVGVG